MPKTTKKNKYYIGTDKTNKTRTKLTDGQCRLLILKLHIIFSTTVARNLFRYTYMNGIIYYNITYIVAGNAFLSFGYIIKYCRPSPHFIALLIHNSYLPLCSVAFFKHFVLGRGGGCCVFIKSFFYNIIL